MVTVEDLEARRERVNQSGELTALERRISQRADRIINQMPVVPGEKALMSRVGGTCPHDGTPFGFDPWCADRWQCPTCFQSAEGDYHRRHWARYQHLWIAEQAASLGALAALGGHDRAGERAVSLLDAYAGYADYPNRDNVLGPARLFFSTYLESVWLTNWLAAAVMLREAGRLPDSTGAIVDQVADEAASLIGEFNEGFSNRQVWHDAALAAVAVWFEDADLAERAIQGDNGLLALMARGLGGDGMWHEGENYHLFALQGMLTGVRWARLCGMDLPADPALAAHLSGALRAPLITALPDATFPARKDARFGVSLAQPMYLELWEVGLGMLSGRDGADLTGMADWLRQRYRDPAPAARFFDSYLFEAGESAPAMRDRTSLSWNVLMEGLAELPEESTWTPPSTLMPSQGLAILRDARRYASLEAGAWSGGHGHPDRLHLSLYADGINWLTDPGTGNYVDRDLFWYRSTLAHNAPLLDGKAQQGGDAHCDAFEAGEAWSWVRGIWDDVTRTIVLGPAYLLDVVQLASDRTRTIELPWHLAGAQIPASTARPADLDLGEFVEDVRQLAPDADGSWRVTAIERNQPLSLTFAGGGELLVATGPGLPITEPPSPSPLRKQGRATEAFLLRRGSGNHVMLATLLAMGDQQAQVSIEGGTVSVELGGERHVHALLSDGWEVQTATERVRLGGRLLRQPAFEPLLTRVRNDPARGTALRVPEPPALDGSMEGFDESAPLMLDHDDQYRRSEDPYLGPEVFSARASINWDDDSLYVAVDVVKSSPTFRPGDATPLDFDNDAEDIHSDGLQLYLQDPEGEVWGVLVVPEAGGNLRIHAVSGSHADPESVRGAWTLTDEGYRVTLALSPDFWSDLSMQADVRFDLAVNEMRDERQRRAGQLIWSGGGGWVYLRGDWHDASRLGVLDLA
ncbi:MAG TPA: heparinase II/III family protein [Gemmatimonadales bacterium]|nr:heparinase II/III family protein [Gemmatimonadales bacterium]